MFISSDMKSGYKIGIINNTNTKTSRHYGCSLVMQNLIEKLEEHKMYPVFFWPVGKDWRGYKEQMQRHLDCDAIIVNGEGSIHNSKELDREYLVEIASFSKKTLKIPCYLINSTLYSNCPDIYDEIKNFDKCYVRESYSYSELKKFNISSAIVPDLTFANNTLSGIKAKKSKKILITDSTLISVREALKEISEKYSWTYITMKVKPNPSLISSSLLSISSFLFGKDLQFFKRLSGFVQTIQTGFENLTSTYRSVTKYPGEKLADHDKFLEEIMDHEFVITGRFHTVTLCIKSETPFIAIESNTPKISALLFDVFGNYNRLISIEELESYKGIIPEKYTSFSKKEIECLKSFNHSTEKKIDQMFQEIHNDIAIKRNKMN